MSCFERDPALLEQYETAVVLALSAGNVHQLLWVALPLPQSSTKGATAPVIEHLDNRTRSRRSRLRKQHKRVPGI